MPLKRFGDGWVMLQWVAQLERAQEERRFSCRRDFTNTWRQGQASGNLTTVVGSGGTYQMGYDYQNRMVRHVRQDGLIATYTYDGDSLKRGEFEYGGACTLVWDGSEYLQSRCYPSGTFVSQQVPLTMTHGQSYPVTLTFQNTGGAPWMASRGFILASANPSYNSTWGISSVALGSSEVVSVGTSKTFSFNVVAPSTAGPYTFSWYIHEGGIGGVVFSTAPSIQVI